MVFAGGSGKGAYQIGTWKYLKEYGLDQQVRDVSGTSVGALNAALFAVGDYEMAEKLWLNISQRQILTPKEITVADVMRWAHSTASSIEKIKSALAFAVSSISTTGAKIISDLNVFKNAWYSFSREGLLELMAQGLDFFALQESDIPCYATCLAIPQYQVERFDLRSYSITDIQTILLASSAIPFI